MPPTLKRKGSPTLSSDPDASKRRFAESSPPNTPSPPPPAASPPQDPETSKPTPSAPLPPDRAARFAALRARNAASRKSNLSETKSEAKRLSTDPSQLQALSRRKNIAEHKLLKADTEAEGEDFERKRAWDWTAEESEAWDARMEGKRAAREKNAFQDFAQEAGKVYERQVAQMERRGGLGLREGYEEGKKRAVERAVAGGGLEIVETEGGELIAVDKDGVFYSTAETTGFAENRPSREAVDRLIEDIRKAEEVRLRKRRERGQRDDGGEDVTFINEKNKQFNQKLARFYDKYTADIRESFERGTAI